MGEQAFYLFILASVVACIAWTITHEEIFVEARKYCVKQSKTCNQLWKRKFFYLFTCEYCFSHYVALFIVLITKFQLLYTDWRGYLISIFALVWVANIYMSLFGRLRQGLKKEKIEANLKKKELEKTEDEPLP